MSYQSPPPKKPNSRLWIGIGGAAIALVALIAVLLLLLNQPASPTAPAPAVIVSAATATLEPTIIATLAVDTPTALPTETATSAPLPELGTSNLFVEYILDASGSMTETLRDGTPKIEVAKRVLIDHMSSFRPETNIGLRAYGHRLPYQRTAESCQDIELIAPPEKGQMEHIVSWLQDFTVQGMTPLAASLQLALEDFIFDASRVNSIVMLSDGIETCGGDPCQLVEDLKTQGINFTLHVIGLDVDDPTRQQLMCIARAGGGQYHDARSQQELSVALGLVREEVTEEEVIVPAGVNTPTPASPTETTQAPTATPSPATNTPTLSTNTPTRSTASATPTATTTAPPTSTPVPPPTDTPPPPTNTLAPPTDTPVSPTATPIPPTATPEPPTATPIPPTVTPEPPTATPPISGSFVPTADAQDVRAAGVGGATGFGLFLMVIGLSARKQRRPR